MLALLDTSDRDSCVERTIGIVSAADMAHLDGPPKLPGAGSVGPLAYPMRRFQGKGSQERGKALKAFLAQLPDLSPPLRAPMP
jgi:hypothetical protein